MSNDAGPDFASASWETQVGLADLDRLATDTFNAIWTARAPDSFEPMECLSELEDDDLTEAVEQWKLIREALEHMPRETLIVPCQLRGVRTVGVVSQHDADG